MAAVPVLRAVRRLRGQVTLVPRILVTPRRSESGGQGAEGSGAAKTLVSFPAKQPQVWPLGAGEDTVGPSAALHHLDVGGGAPGQDIKRPDPRQEEDLSSSSSDSSSDSDSDSDQEAPKEKRPSEPPKNTKPEAPEKKTPQEGPPKEEKGPLSGERTPSGGHDLVENLEDGAPMVQSPQDLPQSGEKTPSVGPDLRGQDVIEVTPKQKSQSVESAPNGGQELRGEDLVDVAPVVGAEEQTPQDLPQSGQETRGGGQELTGEDLVDGAPVVGTEEQTPQSGQETPSGGQELRGEDLDASPVVDIEEKKRAQLGESTPSGGQELTGEELVDVAPVVDPEEQISRELPQSGEEAPNGGPEITGEALGDVAPSRGTAEETSPDVGTTATSDESGDVLASSPDLLQSCDDPEASLTPPPSAAPAPEEPFDNSKYQNEQHYSYTPFTFVDHDVDLSKYRLPQPSSGRPSPRH